MTVCSFVCCLTGCQCMLVQRCSSTPHHTGETAAALCILPCLHVDEGPPSCCSWCTAASNSAFLHYTRFSVEVSPAAIPARCPCKRPRCRYIDVENSTGGICKACALSVVPRPEKK
ncbi:hypothetical protein LZ32DRAFT_173246 [Colletotrichum eremochloae]|nr:hypothetical protein LZ32DRAFT_173246 [Colletotrichum eremochloae]